MTEQKIKFGLGQIDKPTPSWAKWLFRLFFYFTSLTLIAINLFTGLDAHTKLKIAEFVTFANIVVHATSKLFGYDVSEYKNEFNA